jgi:DNA-binding transcriptional LysR family regulator
MDFDLRQLRHARALAEEASFARAARTLHLTQPALSRSIQELERRTGIKLFDRNRGSVEPTDLGRAFLAHARGLLGHAEALDREVATLRGTGTGAMVVGSGTFPTSMFMAEGIGAFLRKNPRVDIRLVNDNGVMLIAALRRRELDFVVAAQPSPEEATDLMLQPLSSRQGCFLARSGHPLLSKPDLTLDDIAAYPVISTSRFSTAMPMVALASRRNREGNRPVPDVACESVEMMRKIAMATDHLLLAAVAACSEAVDRGELVPLPLVDPRLQVAFAVIGLQGRSLPPIADELIEDLVAADRACAGAERELAARVLASTAGAAAGTAPSKRRRQAAGAVAG